MRSDAWTRCVLRKKDGTEEVSERQMGARRGPSAGKFGRGNKDVNTEASSNTRHKGNPGN